MSRRRQPHTVPVTRTPEQAEPKVSAWHEMHVEVSNFTSVRMTIDHEWKIPHLEPLAQFTIDGGPHGASTHFAVDLLDLEGVAAAMVALARKARAFGLLPADVPAKQRERSLRFLREVEERLAARP